MKSTSAFTEAKARRPTSSSGIETWKRSSTSTTSSSASIESSPSASPKIGASSGISLDAICSLRPVERSSFTSLRRASRSIHSRLEHREAAVHVERRPGHVRGGGRRQEEDGRRDLFEAREPPERDLP